MVLATLWQLSHTLLSSAVKLDGVSCFSCFLYFDMELLRTLSMFFDLRSDIYKVKTLLLLCTKNYFLGRLKILFLELSVAIYESFSKTAHYFCDMV